MLVTSSSFCYNTIDATSTEDDVPSVKDFEKVDVHAK